MAGDVCQIRPTQLPSCPAAPQQAYAGPGMLSMCLSTAAPGKESWRLRPPAVCSILIGRGAPCDGSPKALLILSVMLWPDMAGGSAKVRRQTVAAPEWREWRWRRGRRRRVLPPAARAPGHDRPSAGAGPPAEAQRSVSEGAHPVARSPRWGSVADLCGFARRPRLNPDVAACGGRSSDARVRAGSWTHRSSAVDEGPSTTGLAERARNAAERGPLQLHRRRRVR